MDFYAVITCNEGVNIDFDEIKEIQALLYPVYSGKRFGLISNRVNRYSVNPLAINELFSNEHLIAGVIVGRTKATEGNAKIEDQIVTEAPIKFFVDMASAIKWIKDTVREK